MAGGSGMDSAVCGSVGGACDVFPWGLCSSVAEVFSFALLFFFVEEEERAGVFFEGAIVGERSAQSSCQY